MSVTRLVDKFLEFEDRNDLFEREVLGFKFWHFARFGVYRNNILKQKADVGQPHDGILSPDAKAPEIVRARLKRLKWYASNHFGSRAMTHLSTKDAIVICHPRRINEDGYFVCPYTDTILPGLNISYYVFEEPLHLQHASPVKTKHLKYLDGAILRARMKRKMFGTLREKASDEENAMLNDLAGKLQKEFEASFSAEMFQQTILNIVCHSLCLKEELEKLLDRVSPKLIVEVSSYGMINMLFTLIAKRRGIKTIELQHGTMTKHHIAYNYLRKRDLETFPDYFFVFGEYWKRSARLPINEDRVIVTGFPYFEKNIEQRLLGHATSLSKKVILFISEGLDGILLSRLACELSNMIDKNRYHIIYKLHPGEHLHWRKRYPCLINSRIEVADSIDNNIYHYLAISEYVVGVSSTAIYEALPFPLKVFIYAGTNHEYSEDLYKRGYAELVNSAQDIYKALDSRAPDTSGISGEFWAQNATRNIVNNINGMVT